MANVSEELARLTALRNSGALSETEFLAAKAMVLSGGPAAAPQAVPAKRQRRPVLGCLLLIILVIGLVIAFGPKPPPKTAAPIVEEKAGRASVAERQRLIRPARLVKRWRARSHAYRRVARRRR